MVRTIKLTPKSLSFQLKKSLVSICLCLPDIPELRPYIQCKLVLLFVSSSNVLTWVRSEIWDKNIFTSCSENNKLPLSPE